jgi:hypothetical protein
MSNSQLPLPARGSEDGDAAYLERTLRHQPTDVLLDDAVTWRELGAVWRRSVTLAFKIFAVFFILWLITGGPGGVFTSSSRDDGSSTILQVGLFLSLGALLVYWIVFLLGEKQEAISEWCTLLVDKAGAAESVYSHIVGRLRDRQLPISNGFTRRTPTGFGPAGNRLVLVDGHYEVYVSVFGYGTSLYLGWTMWRVRRGYQLVQQCVADSSSPDRLDPVGRILRLERLKAMREAVHAACREALHTAVADIEIPQNYGFPSGLPPIESVAFASAPQPYGAYPAAQR